ncbi:jg2075, partial [Pararge aegeria aegeria]
GGAARAAAPPAGRKPRYVLGTATVGLALIAAEYVYNEKKFFKAAKVGNIQELR